MQCVQERLEVLDVGVGDWDRNCGTGGIARGLVVELHTNTTEIGGDTLDLLLLAGLFGRSKLLALAGWGQEGRHCLFFFFVLRVGE